MEIVEILLLNDVNVNIENAGLFTPLHVAAHFGNISVILVVVLKIQRRVKYNNRKIQFFLGRANIAEFLLKKKANVNALSTQKDTPLHRAAVEGKLWNQKIEY